MAKIPHRVGFDLLADDVKSIIQSGINIFPVNDGYELNINVDGYDYIRFVDGVNKNKIYMWTGTEFKFIGDYPHTHTASQIVDFAHNHDTEYYTKQQIIDEYYTKTEVDNKLYTKADKEIKVGVVQPTDNNMWYREIGGM